MKEIIKPEILVEDLVYDWQEERVAPQKIIEVDDETLRDARQASYIKQPSLDQKKGILMLLDSLNVQYSDFSMTSNGLKEIEESIVLAEFKKEHKLRIALGCAGRTREEDVRSIVEVARQTGLKLEADLFINSSEMGKLAHNWQLDRMIKMMSDSVGLAVELGLDVMAVTEDTTRAKGLTIASLYEAAIEAGAKRICVCDTVGYSTPQKTRGVLRFVKDKVICGKDIKLDWHGHRDQGLEMANVIEAISCGVDRVHATGLGIGERAGNVKMHELLNYLNRQKLGDYNLRKIMQFSHFVSNAMGVPIPVNEPIIGEAAFTTASGVHADAIRKAKKSGRSDLASIVYGFADPEKFDREILIKVGRMSGTANVEEVLERLKESYTAEEIEFILQVAKNSDHILSDIEVHFYLEQARKV